MLRLFLTSLFFAFLGAAAQAAIVSVEAPLCNLNRTVPLTAFGAAGMSSGVQFCSLTIPQFDADAGTLTSVSIDTTVGGLHTVSATNNTATSQPVRISMGSVTGIASGDAAPGPAFEDALGNVFATATAPVIVLGNATRFVGEQRHFPGTYNTVLTGAEAQGFVGEGNMTLDFWTVAVLGFLDEAGNAIAPPASLSFTDVISDMNGTMRVTFTYNAASSGTPVPAPGALGLMLMGLSFLGAGVLRRREEA